MLAGVAVSRQQTLYNFYLNIIPYTSTLLLVSEKYGRQSKCMDRRQQLGEAMMMKLEDSCIFQ